MKYAESQVAPVVVAGAGAGGMATALSAASNGARVVLLDTAEHCGGTVSHALIHTLGGFYDSEGQVVNEGLSGELLDRLLHASVHTLKRRMGKVWVLNVDPAVYTSVLRKWLEEFANIEWRSCSRIKRLKASGSATGSQAIDRVLLATPKGDYEQVVSAVVDATGGAAVVRQWNTDCASSGEALAGFVVQLHEVDVQKLRFPESMRLLHRVRKAAAEGELPDECGTLWLDSGVLPSEAYAKFTLDIADWDEAHMHETALALLAFLRQQDGFEKACISRYGALGIRDGGQVRGRYRLTEEDIKQGKAFIDTACYGCWPIEHWRVGKGVELEYFPSGHRYAIPLSSLQVADVNNLCVAGKSFSAESRVQASARVVGTCWGMGAAVGAYLAQRGDTCH